MSRRQSRCENRLPRSAGRPFRPRNPASLAAVVRREVSSAQQPADAFLFPLDVLTRSLSLDCRDTLNRNAGSAGTASAQQPLGLLQTPGAEIGPEQGELDQIVLRAAAADTLVLTGKGSERLYCRGEIPPLERGKAARQRRQVGA